MSEPLTVFCPHLLFLAACARCPLSFSPIAAVVWFECHGALLCGGLISCQKQHLGERRLRRVVQIISSNSWSEYFLPRQGLPICQRRRSAYSGYHLRRGAVSHTAPKGVGFMRVGSRRRSTYGEQHMTRAKLTFSIASPLSSSKRPTAWLPFLDTYRTMCRVPAPAFRQILENIRELRFAA
jgi:hypothetical protein